MLLLSYLDKIGLILTGEPGRTLAYLHSEAKPYKGARAASLSQSSTLHSTGNTSVFVKEVGHSNTRGTVRALFFSRSNLLLHNSLHFQHLMKTKG